MPEDRRTNRRPFAAGANHQTASITLRDRLFVEDEAVPAMVLKLRSAGLDETVVISTCDRVEVIGAAADPVEAGRVALLVLADNAGVPAAEMAAAAYQARDREAALHLFRVAASLESSVLGEPQVLGQVKACHKMARDAGLPSGYLDDLFQAAYGAAKRARTETAIGDGPVSIASSAVQLVKELHGDLTRVSALMIGNGEMGELVARDLLAGGLSRLVLTHPRRRRAERGARDLEASVRDYEDLADAMREADVIVAAHGTEGAVVTADMVRAALKARKQKPIFLLDTAQPSDVESAVHRLDDAFLYDLADLERIALRNIVEREQAAARAAALIERAVDDFMVDRKGRDAAPAVTTLRARFEEVRAGALRDAGGDAEKATYLMMSRLLHGPSTHLRASAAASELDVTAVEKLLIGLFEGPADGERAE